MKSLRRLVFVSGLCLFLVLPDPSDAVGRGISIRPKQGGSLMLYSDYYALVVGVGDYTAGWPRLPGAGKDAREVAATLKDFGFTVKLVEDPTSQELKKALQEIAFSLGKERDRALLFYFAGHGETLTLADGTKLGYIIPRDCPLKARDPLKFDDLAISMKEIEEVSLKVQSKHFLMLFDSCFSGSLFNLVRAAPVEITEKSAEPVRQFITAGTDGEQVPDQSVFKQVFLDGIHSDADLNGDGYITGSELGMHLQTRVVNYSRGGQHPQYGKINNPKLDKGDFIFVSVSVSLKMQQQKAEEEKKLESEKGALSEDLQRLKEERRKSEELLEQMRKLLEAKMRSDEEQKKGVPHQKALEEKLRREAEEKKALEEELTRLKEEREKNAQAARDLEEKQQEERQLAAQKQKKEAPDREILEEKLRRQAEEKKALEEELTRLREEREKSAQAIHDLERKRQTERQLASVPKESKAETLRKITLRSTPVEWSLTESDVKRMVEKHNFYAKYINETGNFPNSFVDNGDGTVTDRTTDLMWQKGASPSVFTYPQAKGYIEDLNKQKFAGHSDWRVPTLEEICSLLKSTRNERGQFTSGVFSGDYKEVWSSDTLDQSFTWGTKIHTVDFSIGKLSIGSISQYMITNESHIYVKAVRSLQ